ncbi:MAG TPA: 2OG-Fe(II) oxygenase [Allosphingosinicella sp.]|jgi:prolyl 4-hydroxylase|nr:2OG-Fe(II) oxygenase [Allosphingosinicella sp.]
MSARIADQAEMLANTGRAGEAAQLLFSAAAGGDAEALATLAQWRISGHVIRRNLPAARALLARAGAAGHRDSALLHSYFLASGTGGDADWAAALAEMRSLASERPAAAAQFRLLETMDSDGEGVPRSVSETRQLSSAPYVIAAEGFATAAECDYLINAAKGLLAPSMVVDPRSGRLVPHPIRTSDGAVFGVHTEDLVVNAINRRIAALSGTAIEQGEPLQILRYRRGAEYRAHMDALPAEPNQRILTVLVYLTDDYEGGETSFLRTSLSFKGKKGDALLFRNVTATGEPDQAALHAGLPVTRGVKTIASRWIRERRFTYPPPPPLLDL